MIVTLDGQRLADGFQDQATLGEIAECVRTTHLHGRVLAGIWLNGERLLAESLESGLAAVPPPDCQIDLESGSAEAIVAEAFGSLVAQLDQGGEETSGLLGLLQKGHLAGAASQFGAFVSLWQDLVRTVAEGGQLLGRDLLSERYEDRTIGEHLQTLSGRLREIRDAFRARDTVLLADLMEFEMPAQYSAWREIARRLHDVVLVNTPSAAVS